MRGGPIRESGVVLPFRVGAVRRLERVIVTHTLGALLSWQLRTVMAASYGTPTPTTIRGAGPNTYPQAKHVSTSASSLTSLTDHNPSHSHPTPQNGHQQLVPRSGWAGGGRKALQNYSINSSNP